jgi:Putative transposase/Transposase zinc-binding domain
VSLSWLQQAVRRALLWCRTAALGGHLAPCDPHAGGSQRPADHSGRHRHGPTCHALAKARWIQARPQPRRPVGSCHVGCPQPPSSAALARPQKTVVATLRFPTVAATRRAIAADPTHLGAARGWCAVLHTWGQPRLPHPHRHGVVPGGGRSPEGLRWMPCRCPQTRGTPCGRSVPVLSARCHPRCRAALVEACPPGPLACSGDLATRAEPAAVERGLQTACRPPWVVYAKRPCGGLAPGLDARGHSPHRVALANHRLRTREHGRGACAWQDDRHDGVEPILSREALACRRRFWLHVRPRSVVRLRPVGLLATRHVQDTRATGRQRLPVDPAPLLRPTPPTAWDSLDQQLTGNALDQGPRCPQGRLVWHTLP